MIIQKKCKSIVSKKQTHQYYNRKELEELVITRLKLNKKDVKKLTKQKMCKLLNIIWQYKKPINQTNIISNEKVCTDRNCKKSFPNRYNKTTLVELAKKNSHYIAKTH